MHSASPANVQSSQCYAFAIEPWRLLGISEQEYKASDDYWWTGGIGGALKGTSAAELRSTLALARPIWEAQQGTTGTLHMNIYMTVSQVIEVRRGAYWEYNITQ